MKLDFLILLKRSDIAGAEVWPRPKRRCHSLRISTRIGVCTVGNLEVATLF